MATACHICGVYQYHEGAVDCINALRKHVTSLQSLLPVGEEVMRSTLTRDSSVRVWIAGPVTVEGLDRLIRFIGFMREAFAESNGPEQPSSDKDGEAALSADGAAQSTS